MRQLILLPQTVGGGGSHIRNILHKNDGSFNKLCSIENLSVAWEKFKKGKSARKEVMEFEYYLEDNLFALYEELAAGNYQHGLYHPFAIHDPKKRRIHKATVRDRVVHQTIVNIIEPLFEKQFVFDSYSCRKGKGTHAAVRRLQSCAGKASDNHTKTVYALKCDIKKFFDSVDHGILSGLLGRRIRCERTFSFLENIISSYQTKPGKGIPLGNLTSQLFANVYLHELDRFIKFELREKYYLRYCDDFVLLHLDRNHLENLIPKIDEYLQSRLKLRLHPNKVVIRAAAQGIDFLGYIALEKATIIRTKTKRRALRLADLDNVSSYFGLCGHANAYELTQQIQNKLWLTN